MGGDDVREAQDALAQAFHSGVLLFWSTICLISSAWPRVAEIDIRASLRKVVMISVRGCQSARSRTTMLKTAPRAL